MFQVVAEYGNSKEITEAGGLLLLFGLIVRGIDVILSPDDGGRSLAGPN